MICQVSVSHNIIANYSLFLALPKCFSYFSCFNRMDIKGKPKCNFMLNRKAIMIGLPCCFCMVINAPAQNCDSGKILTGRSDTLQNTWILNRLQIQFDQRRSDLKSSMVSEEKLLGRRDQNRKWMAEKVGDLPAKTSLNPVFFGENRFGYLYDRKGCF